MIRARNAKIEPFEGQSSMRVVRGGAWSDPRALLRSSARMRATQSGHVAAIGFRVARSLV